MHGWRGHADVRLAKKEMMALTLRSASGVLVGTALLVVLTASVGIAAFNEETAAVLTDVGNSSAAWGDYDNDGDLDLALAGSDAGGVRSSTIYRNDGGGVFTDIGAGLTGVDLCSLAWGDIDNDGDLDLMVCGAAGVGADECQIYRNEGSDTFVDVGAYLTGLDGCSLAWGDFDNDGDLDFAVAGGTAGG